MGDQVLFSAASLLTILSSIEELDAEQIDLDTDESGITVSIDGNEYRFDYNNESTADIEVSEDDLKETEAVIEQESESQEEPEEIEAGIISGLLKTLAVGGLVRLTGKLLKE